jgi:hypothetical protein
MVTTGRIRTDLLLPGENPGSLHPGDVRHWIAVYEDLLRTVPGLAPSKDGVMNEHIEHWQERLEFWKQRDQQMARS